MSAKTRRKLPPPKQSRRPRLLFAALALLLLAGWWFFLRQPETAAVPGGGAALAAYRPTDVHALQVSPTDERTVVFGHHRGMLVSHDAGAIWVPASGASGDAMGVALPPGSQTEFAAGHDIFMRSDNGGRTWASVKSGLPGTDIHGFAASAVIPNTFYAYVVGSGLFKSADAGTTWQKAGDISGGTMSMTVAKSGGTDILYANTMEGVQRSRDGGRSWESVREVGGATLNATGETVYAAAGSVVLASNDGGMTWQRRTFTRGGAVLVAAAPTNPKTVYVLTDKLEVWHSADGGVTWERSG
ncbi:MAG TPA: hypothetical protein VIN34_02080 [Candidatus Limnocylindria bacterium]